MKIQQARWINASLLHVMMMHLNPPSTIGRSWLNRNNSIKRRVISTVDHDPTVDLTVTPLFFYKFSVLRDGNVPLDFRVKSNCLDTTIQVSIDLFIFLTHFHVRGAFEIENWSRGEGEITSWTPSLSSKSQNEKPWIRWLIGSFQRLLWVRLCVFILIFHYLVLILHFES